MSSTDCPDTALLQRALAGHLLSPEQAEGLAGHLEACGECAAALQRLPDEDRLLPVARAAALRPGGPPLTGSLAELLRRLKALGGGTTPGAADTSGPGGNTPVPDGGRAADLDPPQAPDELGRIGPYRLLRVLGAGGMGVVYLAEDLGLKRRVALKVMNPVLAANPAARRRFQREAEAMAAVEHDHIVAVYQVGEHRGAPFLAMPLLKGESLEARLKREPRLPLPELLRVGREAAEGLAAAHEKGLVHRDVKPGNLWLEEGRGRVKVLDFGLARPAEGGPDLTHGMVVGTPAYMAPEQATAQAVDHRCDLFSLACVLYRMATGEAPFSGQTPWQVLHSVTHDEPPLAHTKRPDLPLPLSYFIQRMLSKGRDKRPASAREVIWALTTVAEKLEANIGSPPATLPEAQAVAAKPPAVVPPVGRRPWKKRLTVAVILLALGGAGLYAGAQIIIRIRDKDGRVTEVKTDGKEEITLQAGGTEVKVGPAPDRPKEGAKALAPDKKAKALPPPPAPDLAAIKDVFRVIAELRAARHGLAASSPLDALRHERVPLAERRAVGDPPELVGLLGSHRLKHVDVLEVHYSPDGKRLASRGKRGALRVWDADTGEQLYALRGPSDYRNEKSNVICWAPDGARLAIETEQGIVLCDAASGKQTEVLGRCYQTRSICFSPDGKYLAAGGGGENDGELIVWDLQSKRQFRLTGHKKGVRSVSFHPNAKLLTSGAGVKKDISGELKVWSLESGKEVFGWGGENQSRAPVIQAGFSPDGKWLAATSVPRSEHAYNDHPSTLLWKTEDWQLAGSLPADLDGRFDFDGAGRLLRVGSDRTMNHWDLQSRKVAKTTKLPVRGIAFDIRPDGRRLAVGSGTDSGIVVVGSERGEVVRGPVGPVDVPEAVISLDGKHLLYQDETRSLKRWDFRGDRAEVITNRAGSGACVFGPGGLLRQDWAQERMVVDGRTGKELFRLSGNLDYGAHFSSDGRRLAVGLKNPSGLGIWDVESGKQVSALAVPPDDVVRSSFSPDGRQIVIQTVIQVNGGRKHLLKIWDTTTGLVVRSFAVPIGFLRLVGLSRDGRSLAVEVAVPGTVHESVQLLDAETGAPRLTLEGPELDLEEVTFSPDGRLIAAAAPGRIRLWDAASGKRKGMIRFDLRIKSLLFHPDGRHLIVGAATGTVYVLRLTAAPKPGG